MRNIKEQCLEGAEECETVGEDEVCEGFRSMARAEQSPAQAPCCGDKGSQALDEQDSGVGMGYVVGRGTTQPSGQKGGSEMDAKENLCGMENVGDKGPVKELRRQKALQEKMELRMRSAGIYKAWTSWF